MSNLANEAKLSFISPEIVKEKLEKINEPLKEFTNIKEETQQIVDVFKIEKLYEDPLAVHPTEVKNKLASD
jgi:hypothetical protein